MRAAVIATGLLLCAGGALADVQQLQQFLHGVEEATAVPVPLRGDGTLEAVTASGTRRQDLVVIVRPPADQYLELRPSGLKVLLLNQKNAAYRLPKGAAKAEALPAAAPVADSDFTCDDLRPFRLADYRDWRISDETASEITVTLFPQAASQYSLVVITFDRDKQVPLKTLYYRDTVSNLVKMRRDDGYELIGRKWMPTTISMESFKLRTHSTITLRWTQGVSFPPELFDPVFLPHPSPLSWPTAPGGK